LLRPPEVVNAGLDSPPTPHRQRAMLDAVAVLLVRCAQTGRTFWGWSSDEWTQLLGGDQVEFCRNAPEWAGDEVRPYLAAQAYLLGSFTEFHRLGSFQRLNLSRRIFGCEQVDKQIGLVRKVLAQWGYQLGCDDDTLPPNVLSQLFLFNSSPHLQDMHTDLFDRFRADRMLRGAQMNTLYAVQRAVAELGFCDPPHHRTGTHNLRASGGAPVWEQWADRWHATSTLTPRTRNDVRAALLKVGRWLAAEPPRPPTRPTGHGGPARRGSQRWTG
jgi:hypothetical protein